MSKPLIVAAVLRPGTFIFQPNPDGLGHIFQMDREWAFAFTEDPATLSPEMQQKVLITGAILYMAKQLGLVLGSSDEASPDLDAERAAADIIATAKR
jgi:hypothetical protein